MVNSSDPKALQEKLQEVLSDEAFAKELLKMEDVEDVQIALEKKDIEMSLDEIRQAGNIMKKLQSGELSLEQAQNMADGELSEDELEEVAGGFGLFGCLIVACIACFAGGGVGGALGGALGGW